MPYREYFNEENDMLKKIKKYGALVIGTLIVLGCCMVPVTYKGSIGQNAQEAVLIHDGDREELVLRINYRITGKKMPDSFVWVITTPKEPDAYALADPELFKEMFDLSEKLVVPISKSRFQGDSAGVIPEGVELGTHVKVGPYDIQPVRGVGANALTGLNKWLKANGFPTEAPDHMTYFVKNNFTFLCIRITPPEKKKSVSSGGLLPPLHLSFQTPTPYYPLRFSSRQGVFDVNLHVLTRKELDYKASDATLKKLNWWSKNYKKNVAITTKTMPETLKKVFMKSVWKDKVGTWNYNNIRCSNVNKGDTIGKWKKDVFFNTK